MCTGCNCSTCSCCCSCACQYCRFERSESPYRFHYVCFDCNRGWKGPYNKKVKSNCSTCGKEGIEIGRDGRYPKKDDIKGWKQLKMYVDLGIYFENCDDCTKYKIVLPKNESEIDDYNRKENTLDDKLKKIYRIRGNWEEKSDGRHDIEIHQREQLNREIEQISYKRNKKRHEHENKFYNGKFNPIDTGQLSFKIVDTRPKAVKRQFGWN